MTDPSSPAGVFGDLQGRLRDQIDRKPYASVLVALAAGYVLGGGVPWWAVRSAASIGGRVLVTRALTALVEPE